MQDCEWVEYQKECNEEIRVAARLGHTFISAGFLTRLLNGSSFTGFSFHILACILAAPTVRSAACFNP